MNSMNPMFLQQSTQPQQQLQYPTQTNSNSIHSVMNMYNAYPNTNLPNSKYAAFEQMGQSFGAQNNMM